MCARPRYIDSSSFFPNQILPVDVGPINGVARKLAASYSRAAAEWLHRRWTALAAAVSAAWLANPDWGAPVPAMRWGGATDDPTPGAGPIAPPEAAVAALRDHAERQVVERRLADDRWCEHGLVFPTRRGTPQEPRNVQRRFEAVRAHRAAKVCFHDLRHTCATLLIVQGVHRRVVMEMLGHSQISRTMHTYVHVAADHLPRLLVPEHKEQAG